MKVITMSRIIGAIADKLIIYGLDLRSLCERYWKYKKLVHFWVCFTSSRKCFDLSSTIYEDVCDPFWHISINYSILTSYLIILFTPIFTYFLDSVIKTNKCCLHCDRRWLPSVKISSMLFSVWIFFKFRTL